MLEDERADGTGRDYFIVPTRTDGRTDDTDYLSVRITIEHSKIDDVKKDILHDVDVWCIYLHGGGSTSIAEHMHICIPGSATGKFRKRIRDHYGGGNKNYSVTQFRNGLSGFVFYCSHEGSSPIFKGSEWPPIIRSVSEQGGYKKRRIDDHFQPKEKRVLERDWTLTYTNIVPQAVIFQKKFMKGEESLKRVVKVMMEKTKWRPCREMYKKGVPDVYQKDFEFRLGVRSEMDMDWWACKDFT